MTNRMPRSRSVGPVGKSILSRVIGVMLTLLTAGCASSPLDHATVEPLSHRVSAESLSIRNGTQVAAVDPNSGDWTRRPRRQIQEVVPGTGQFWKSEELPPSRPRRGAAFVTPTGNDEVTLNLVNVTVAEAAKSILGDALGANYVIDERVQARITLQTTNPVHVDGLLEIFETVLSANGAAIVNLSSGGYKIVPSGEAGLSALPIRVRGGESSTQGVGRSVQVVPLRFVAAADMQRILEPMAPQGAILRVDETRNLIFLAGTGGELKSMFDAIDTFDVDWLRGMSFALIPVKASDPATIASELETVFASGEGGPSKGVVRFIPNRRLKAILVLSTQAQYLKRATDWVTRLDAAAEATERQLFVYNVQNRGAKELAAVLQSILSPETAAAESQAAVAPKYEPVQLASGKSDRQNVADTGAANDSFADPGFQPPPPPSALITEDGARVVADDANNALLIFATAEEHRRILGMLRSLDGIPNQVLIEATIAEVSLTDDLRFGVRWFFEEKSSSWTFSDALSGAVASTFPGFSYLLAGTDVRVVVNAIASVTDVEVISSPSLMVLDNRKAVLQVGDQVPIVTQTAVSVENPDAPVVNSVELKDTGIILTVTPKVADSGRVLLDIEQEVSDVVPTTSSGIDSPTIKQRKVRTTVVVNDGDSLVLGGLIQQGTSRTRDKVPLLGDIPVLGSAFRSTDEKLKRTELLILITPRVVRDLEEAGRVTEEFRRELKNVATQVSRKRHTPIETVKRILE